jgi:RNA polymerase sigma factor (sigma-70 family)
MAVTESGHLASQAVDDLYRRHGSEVYRYAFAVLGNHADAEDVTQTTFLNAYRAIEQGVRPRKPSNWLLAIASNTIKQRFRQEQARPRQVELDEQTARAGVDEDEGPTVGELLSALSRIPPQQRQAIVLREFEGRSYREIADILGVTTSALETLLFRARRSLAEELEHQLTCTEAQQAISRAVDGRLGRKERRRLRHHLGECPDCSHFASVQKRHRRALKGLMFLPVPLSLSFVKGIEGTAAAATLPAGAGAVAAAGAGVGAGATTGGGILAGGVGLKAAAVVTAATMATGVAVVGSSETDTRPVRPPALAGKPGERLGQVAPRGVLVPGNGVARGKAAAPGQSKKAAAKRRSHGASRQTRAQARGKSATAKALAQGQARSRAATKPAGSTPGATNRATKEGEAPASTKPKGTVRTSTPAAAKAAAATEKTTGAGRSMKP